MNDLVRYGLPAEVKFCARCVISNQRPNSCVEFTNQSEALKETIRFDDEGVCDACRVAEQKRSIDWEGRRKELRVLCDRFRRVDGRYDVIVPGSGGKDSWYAAWKLRYEFGMNPLLVTWAPTLPTEWGLRNLTRWQSIAAHELHTPKREVHRLITRFAVERLFHPFQPFVLGQKALAPKLAAKYGVPLVMYGENEAEYGNPQQDASHAVRNWQYFARPDSEIHIGGVSLGELHTRGVTRNDLLPYMPADPEDLRRVGVRVYYLGYYLRWHPQGAYYHAVEHGGFECSPERTPGTYSKYNSIDDKIDDFHYWATFQKFGIGRATYDAAQETRSGDITREEGVALVHKFDGEYPERFEADVNEYLSVDGFPQMTRERWYLLAAHFRSPHLFTGEGKLRRRVENTSKALEAARQ